MSGSALGVLAKAAFRLGSDQGMVNAAYPTDEAGADAEETRIGGSDLIPLLSESIDEGVNLSFDETIIGSPAISGGDKVSILPSGGLDAAAFYDGLDALIFAVLGFEKPEAGDGPVAQSGTALTSTASGATSYKDAGNPFVAGDVGKFIQTLDGAAEGQVRRISAYVGAGEVTVTPAWDSNPADATTAVMAQEWLHTYECANRMADMLWPTLYSGYPTGGVGTANDQVIRRGDFAVSKNSATKPWVWRGCYVNALTISIEAGGAMNISVELLPFNLDRDSATNLQAQLTEWDWDNNSPLFQSNERVMFPDIQHFRLDDYSTGTALTSADDIGISKLELSINNNLAADDLDSVSGLYRVEPARSSHREITGSFSVPRYGNNIGDSGDLDAFDEWRQDETTLMANLKMQGTTIANVARYLNMWLPSLRITNVTKPVNGPNVVVQDVTFRCLTPTGQASGFPTHNLTTPRSEVMIQTLNQCPYNQGRDQQKEY